MRLKRIYEVWKKGELKWKLSQAIYLTKTHNQNIFFIKNKFIKELQIEEKSYRKLKKEFHSFIKDYVYSDEERKINRTVWICWMQGEDSAPDLVKACISSARKNLNNFRVIVLSESNVADYIVLPEHVVKKYKEGKISKTHFSDILRVAILCQYGGLWIDSTVLCTDGDFAERITKLPLFVYKVLNLNQNDEEAIMASSWLIYAKSNDRIMILTRDMLYRYWEKHEYLTNYFLVHICFSIAARENLDEWNAIPMYNNRSPHTLMFELGNPFSQDRWDEIKKMSSFHKLTRHIEYSSDDTFYKFIIDTNRSSLQ